MTIYIAADLDVRHMQHVRLMYHNTAHIGIYKQQHKQLGDWGFLKTSFKSHLNAIFTFLHSVLLKRLMT